jgi:hypothetical protein
MPNQMQMAMISALLISFNEPLPSGECAKIEKLIAALQKVYSDHCPIAES